MKIDIIIVNWNAGDQLKECIGSIEQFGGEYVKKVVIVDNGSSDDSMQGIDKSNVAIEIIYNHENNGFGRACNQAINICNSKYILLLNPDTRLFENSIILPLSFLENDKNEDVGTCGIQLVDERGNIARSCARFPKARNVFYKMLGLSKLFPQLFPGIIMEEWDHKESQEVDHVIGAFFLVRRKVIDQIGGFDECFFVYLEDLDFSLRAYNAGWRCYYIAEVKAYHKGGGTSEQVKTQRLFYSLNSRILFGYKHFGVIIGMILHFVTLFLEPQVRIMSAISRRSVLELKQIIKAFGLLWKAVPEIFRYVINKKFT